MTHDADLRALLHRDVLAPHKAAGALVFDEFGIQHGQARADVAMVNGSLHGFELKSAADSLKRLPVQAAAYSAVFDFCTLVVAPEHHKKAWRHVEGWGISVAHVDRLEVICEPARNHAQVPLRLAQLLWRDEALALLREHSEAKGLSAAPRVKLCRAIADALPLRVIRAAVLAAIKARVNWR